MGCVVSTVFMFVPSLKTKNTIGSNVHASGCTGVVSAFFSNENKIVRRKSDGMNSFLD